MHLKFGTIGVDRVLQCISFFETYYDEWIVFVLNSIMANPS
jgi:hypothetical protein